MPAGCETRGGSETLSPKQVYSEALGRLRLLAKAVKPTFLDAQSMETAAHFARKPAGAQTLLLEPAIPQRFTVGTVYPAPCKNCFRSRSFQKYRP